MPSEVAKKIMALLAPSVGEFYAKSAVIASCRMIGADMETLDKTHIQAFADRLESMIQVHYGPEIAKSVKEKVLAL